MVVFNLGLLGLGLVVDLGLLRVLLVFGLYLLRHDWNGNWHERLLCSLSAIICLMRCQNIRLVLIPLGVKWLSIDVVAAVLNFIAGPLEASRSIVVLHFPDCLSGDLQVSLLLCLV